MIVDTVGEVVVMILAIMVYFSLDNVANTVRAVAVRFIIEAGKWWYCHFTNGVLASMTMTTIVTP